MTESSASALQSLLTEFAENGDPVHVTRTDGKQFVGVLHPAAVYGEFRLQTGRRGRPPVLTVENVASVNPVTVAV